MSCHEEVAARLAGKVGNLDAWSDLIDFACATGVPAEVIAGEILDDLFWEELRERLGELSAADRALVRMVRGRLNSDIAAITEQIKQARDTRGTKSVKA
jgi:hypothetical protein